MKSKVPDLLEKGRVARPGLRSDRGYFNGYFIIKSPVKPNYLCLLIGAPTEAEWVESDLKLPAWEHVSISIKPQNGEMPDRIPVWEEMCFVKDLCWEPEDLVLQFHPPKSSYINVHPMVLHLWRPIGVNVPLPPIVCV